MEAVGAFLGTWPIWDCRSSCVLLRVGWLVSLPGRNHGRDDVAMTIQVADCLSDIQALTELQRSSLALVNIVRELCEDEAGNFATWSDMRIP